MKRRTLCRMRLESASKKRKRSEIAFVSPLAVAAFTFTSVFAFAVASLMCDVLVAAFWGSGTFLFTDDAVRVGVEVGKALAVSAFALAFFRVQSSGKRENDDGSDQCGFHIRLVSLFDVNA